MRPIIQKGIRGFSGSQSWWLAIRAQSTKESAQRIQVGLAADQVGVVMMSSPDGVELLRLWRGLEEAPALLKGNDLVEFPVNNQDGGPHLPDLRNGVVLGPKERTNREKRKARSRHR